VYLYIYNRVPVHGNWQIESAVWNSAGFLHRALEPRMHLCVRLQTRVHVCANECVRLYVYFSVSAGECGGCKQKVLSNHLRRVKDGVYYHEECVVFVGVLYVCIYVCVRDSGCICVELRVFAYTVFLYRRTQY